MKVEAVDDGPGKEFGMLADQPLELMPAIRAIFHAAAIRLFTGKGATDTVGLSFPARRYLIRW